jgi:hypothetical protein
MVLYSSKNNNFKNKNSKSHRKYAKTNQSIKIIQITQKIRIKNNQETNMDPDKYPSTKNHPERRL